MDGEINLDSLDPEDVKNIIVGDDCVVEICYDTEEEAPKKRKRGRKPKDKNALQICNGIDLTGPRLLRSATKKASKVQNRDPMYYHPLGCSSKGKDDETPSVHIKEDEQAIQPINNIDIFSGNASFIQKYICSDEDEKWTTIGQVEGLLKALPRPIEKPNLLKSKEHYICWSCGDLFIFKRYYDEHLKRRTMCLIIDCKYCLQNITFANICLLKNHIFIHEGTTINSDTKIRVKLLLLPTPVIPWGSTGKPNNSLLESTITRTLCLNCGIFFKSLDEHLFGKNKPELTFTCRICTYILPTYCSFSFHMKLHTKESPFCCPECGAAFESFESVDTHMRTQCYHYDKSISPYCKYCGIIFLEGEKLRAHIISDHTSLIYKCVQCAAIFDTLKESNIHSKTTHTQLTGKRTSLYNKCHFCKDVIIPKGLYGAHVSEHIDNYSSVTYVFKCGICTFVTNNKVQFQEHRSEKHSNVFGKISPSSEVRDSPPPPVHLSILPGDKSNMEDESKVILENKDSSEDQKVIYKCTLCNLLMDLDWASALGHFSCYHKENETIDPQKYIVTTSFELEKTNNPQVNHIPVPDRPTVEPTVSPEYIAKENAKTNSKTKDCVKPVKSKRTRRRRRRRFTPLKKKIKLEDYDEDIKPVFTPPKNNLECFICGLIAPGIEAFRDHVITHRRDPTVYQCLECGLSYMVRSTLEMHLTTTHDITNTGDYINNYNVCDKLIKKPLKDHQCSVCREIYDSAENLQKHFRSHGMAFLNYIKQT